MRRTWFSTSMRWRAISPNAEPAGCPSARSCASRLRIRLARGGAQRQLAAAIAIENEDAQRAREIGGRRRAARRIDAGDQRIHREQPRPGHLAQRLPEFRLERDASAMPG